MIVPRSKQTQAFVPEGPFRIELDGELYESATGLSSMKHVMGRFFSHKRRTGTLKAYDKYSRLLAMHDGTGLVMLAPKKVPIPIAHRPRPLLVKAGPEVLGDQIACAS